MEVTVEVVVAEVTVYPDRARVLCRGEANLDAGSHHLLLEELPVTLEPDSVRAGGRGPGPMRLLSVDVLRKNYERAPAGIIQELEQAIEGTEDELRLVADRKAGLEARAAYLQGMRQATREYARGLARGQSSVADQAGLLLFLQEEDDAVRAGLRQADGEQRLLERRLKKLKQDLAGWTAQRPLQRYQAQMEVEVAQAGNYTVELAYVVGRAGWQPLYDARLLEGEAGPELALTSLAQVWQQTGQDWNGVRLALSTARPALNQRLPELGPWYVDVYVPPRPLVTRARLAEKPAAPSPATGVLAAAPEAGAAAEMPAEAALATVEDAGMAVQFVAPGHVDVPGDGSPHKTTLAESRLPARVDYLAIPRHTGAVYRRLKVQNAGPAPWLPGQVSLFAQESFIGRTSLEHTPRQEEVELLYGVEERLTVTRELALREVDKRMLRDRRQIRVGYEIELQNLLPGPASLSLCEHFPVSRHEEIKCRLESASPEPDEQSELNLLEWKLELAPGEKRTVRYVFLVEHPRELAITGLNV